MHSFLPSVLSDLAMSISTLNLCLLLPPTHFNTEPLSVVPPTHSLLDTTCHVVKASSYDVARAYGRFTARSGGAGGECRWWYRGNLLATAQRYPATQLPP